MVLSTKKINKLLDKTRSLSKIWPINQHGFVCGCARAGGAVVELFSGAGAFAGNEVFNRAIGQEGEQGEQVMRERFPELLAVLYIRRQRGMHQLMSENSEHLGRVGEIGPDDDFMVAVIGGGRSFTCRDSCGAHFQTAPLDALDAARSGSSAQLAIGHSQTLLPGKGLRK